MKKFLFTFLFSLVFISGYSQQPPIMVCDSTGSACTPYSNLDDAVAAASAGSYIYVPGGIYPVTSTINKELHLIGAGFYPDSTNVTGVSYIYGGVRLDLGCSNSTFEGLNITGGVSMGNTTTTATINNVKFVKCLFNGFNLWDFSSHHVTYCNNCFVTDCICEGDFIPYCNNTTVSNSIITGMVAGILASSLLENCIFYGVIGNNSAWPYDNSNSCMFKNNIFDSSANSGYCGGCILNNNITIYSSMGISGVSTETGTISSVPISNLFVNAATTGFDFSKDYHLKSTSPGHNAGTDGTDIGIYGGDMPHAPGAVPSNPHFFYQNVNGTTDSTGNLSVHVKVRASN